MCLSHVILEYLLKELKGDILQRYWHPPHDLLLLYSQSLSYEIGTGVRQWRTDEPCGLWTRLSFSSAVKYIVRSWSRSLVIKNTFLLQRM